MGYISTDGKHYKDYQEYCNSFLQSHSGIEAITMLHVEGIKEYVERR